MCQNHHRRKIVDPGSTVGAFGAQSVGGPEIYMPFVHYKLHHLSLQLFGYAYAYRIDGPLPGQIQNRCSPHITPVRKALAPLHYH